MADKIPLKEIDEEDLCKMSLAALSEYSSEEFETLKNKTLEKILKVHKFKKQGAKTKAELIKVLKVRLQEEKEKEKEEAKKDKGKEKTIMKKKTETR
jgi:hypothetical protein